MTRPSRTDFSQCAWLKPGAGCISPVVGSGCAESKRAAVVSAETGWSDVGDWHGLGNLLDRDPHGNSVRGKLVQIGTTNSAIWSDTQRLIALVGLDNVIVVDTPDALLVADRAKAKHVRNIVDLVGNAGRLQLW